MTIILIVEDDPATRDALAAAVRDLGHDVRIGCTGTDLPSAIARLEEMLIRRALQRSGGSRADAARLLGIHRQLLYTKLKRYGIEGTEEQANGGGG